MDNQNTSDNGQPGPAPEPQAPTPAPEPTPAPQPQPVEQPVVGAADPATAASEEKCATCGNSATGGNCSTCGQNQMACACPPAQAGGQGGPSAPIV
ncbi:hypothetical protein HYW43_05210 [Candidatus Daviesbacteria bacterium]|nr:hypothetical protein [Candidatus Daviesbacteria bacterium]